MPTISGRVRPIEKFAEAVGKCSVEVRSRVSTLYRWTGTDFALRLRHTANVSLQTISQSIKTCVRKNLCASKIVIWYVHPVVMNISLRIYGSTDTRTESCKEALEITSFKPSSKVALSKLDKS